MNRNDDIIDLGQRRAERQSKAAEVEAETFCLSGYDADSVLDLLGFVDGPHPICIVADGETLEEVRGIALTPEAARRLARELDRMVDDLDDFRRRSG